jgi:hypothetical protein
MAVSQGKMLGHYSWGPGGYRCRCCKADSTRYRKTAERREVAAIVAEYLDGAEVTGEIPEGALERWQQAARDGR